MSPENVPEVWDDGRDGAFFGIARYLFPPAFTAAATVLLASYDMRPHPWRRDARAQHPQTA